MKCNHPKWIIGRNNLGTCVMCGKTKQFPVEKKQVLRSDERSFIENLNYEVDFDGWTYGKLYNLEKLA